MANNTANQNILITEQVQSMLIKPLETASVVLANGPTVFNSAAPIRVPRINSTGNVGFVGEGEKIPDDYVADLGELSLMPSDRKSLKAISKVSNELVRQAAVGVTSVLQQSLVEDVRKELDEALLNGTGADNTITGIFNQPGTQKGVLDMSDPDSLLDAIALAEAAEVTPDRWFFNPADYMTLRKLKDGDGRYLMQATMQEGAKFQLHGIPVVSSNRVEAGKGALLNMKEVAVVRDLDARISILTEKYADYDQVGVKIVSRWDLGLIRPEGVIILEGA